MPDQYYNKNVVQLRAEPGFTGYMNQANVMADAFLISPTRITNAHSFLNSHSFAMTSGNKLKSGDSLYGTLFSGSGTQYTDFTFEARVRLTSLSTNTWLIEFPSTAASSSKKFGITTAGKLALFSNVTASVTQTDSEVITTGVDYHFAYVRAQGTTYSGQKIMMFINGRKVFDQNTSVYAGLSITSNNPVVIGGSFYNDTGDLVGYMDDIRIAPFARYSDNFTPPTNSDFYTPSSSLWLPLRPDFTGNLNRASSKDKRPKIRENMPSLEFKKREYELYKSKTNVFSDYYGNANIRGVTQIDGVASPNLMVYLLHRGSKRILRVTKSDIDGNYAFTNMMRGVTYSILGEDDEKKPITTRRNAFIRDFVNISNTPELSRTTLATNSIATNTYTEPVTVYGGSSLSELTSIYPFYDSLVGDQNREKVVLLMDFQGDDIDRVLLDLSDKKQKILSSSVFVNKSTPLNGVSSLNFLGVGSYLYSDIYNENFDFPGDFTITIDVRTTTTTNVCLLDRYIGEVNSVGWRLFINSSGFVYWWVYGGTYNSLTGTSFVSDGLKHTITVSRKNNVLYIFVDGVLDKSIADTNDYKNFNPTILGIGGQINSRQASYDFNGTIGYLKITKGEGLYTNTHSLPVRKNVEFSPSSFFLGSQIEENSFKVKSNQSGALTVGVRTSNNAITIPSFTLNVV